MTAAFVIVRMLTEGERAESPSPHTLSGPVYPGRCPATFINKIAFRYWIATL